LYNFKYNFYFKLNLGFENLKHIFIFLIGLIENTMYFIDLIMYVTYRSNNVEINPLYNLHSELCSALSLSKSL